MTEQTKIKCKVCCDTGIVYTGPMGDPPEACEACVDQEPAEQIMTNTAPEFLNRAATIMEERGKQYDKPGGERSMGKTVAAFNAITGRDLSEAEGWLLLQVLKDVRQWQNPGYHADSAEDCIAYSALKAEALAAQQEQVHKVVVPEKKHVDQSVIDERAEENRKRQRWNVKQWYEHVGAWETPEGYIAFGSVMALRAMLHHFYKANIESKENPNV